LKGQDIFKEHQIHRFILQFVKAHFLHKTKYEELEQKLDLIFNDRRLDSSAKWNEMRLLLSAAEEKSKKMGKYSTTELCLADIMLNILYPRLDINVSKHINHLLKSPFCIHPGTGLISVPLNENDIINFNLDFIPSIEETLDDFMDNK
jgi:DNA primase small subunit